MTCNSSGANQPTIGTGGLGTAGRTWETIWFRTAGGVWRWKFWTIGFPSLWRFYRRESNRWASKRSGFTLVFLRSNSDLDFGRVPLEETSSAESGTLRYSWVEEFSNWGIANWYFPLFLNDLFVLSKLWKTWVLGFPLVCGCWEARMTSVCSWETTWSHQGKYTTLFTCMSLFFPTQWHQFVST